MALITILLILLAAPAMAEEMLPLPAQEARAQDVMAQIRCLVCQAQSVADSPAPIARDLRQLIREDVATGMDNDLIFDQLRARYGDRVLLSPPLTAETVLLWAAPALILLAALLGARGMVRRRGNRGAR